MPFFCNFICLTLSLTPETKGIIDLSKLEKMKRTAILVNGGRDELIVEKDLITALDHGLIKAAGLDVYEKEPISLENPIINYTNVVTLPHVGSATHETRLQMAKLAIQNLLNILENKPLENVINVERVFQ